MPERRDGEAEWEEDLTIQPQERWLSIPEVIANTALDPDSNAVLTTSAIVFLGVLGAKHQCRPATDEELQQLATESPIKAPAFFNYGRQRFCDVLIEVFGACSRLLEYLSLLTAFPPLCASFNHSILTVLHR
jgi:hypothetical protein